MYSALGIQPRLAEADRTSMERRLDISTTALLDCESCGRHVAALHADCDLCYQQAPDASPLERCEHFLCRRCGEEL